MPARWTPEDVLALAPDDSSRRAARRLGRPAPWTDTGAAGDVVWGRFAGSGATPYQTIVDLSGPAYHCSCPSRKFPCKHALGLLLIWSGGAAPDAEEPSGFAAAWLAARRKQPAAATGTTAAGQTPAEARARLEKNAAAEKRARDRADRVADGLAELTEWLRDQVRVGLAASVQAASAQAGTARSATGAATGLTSAVAARMVDAQAPGVAGTLRGLSPVTAAGDEWPARLLGEYALLHLLARAHERLAELPPGLVATVRSRIGYTTSRADVLARPPVTDDWLVLAVRDLLDGAVPARRIWLRGADTGLHAMLLTFAGNGFWQDPDTARLRPGTKLRAALHYYPGEPPTRALTGERLAKPAKTKCPGPDGDIAAVLAAYAAGLAQDPWLTTWPAVLYGTPVPPGQGAGQDTHTPHERWHFVDRTGAALPLADTDSRWTLLAVSGGQPVTLAGEWHPDGLLPLTVWHGDEAVVL
jgi:hypothetical protein